jgi:hypothetical protein
MTGTYSVLGHPISVAGVWLKPPQIAVATAGAASPGAWTWPAAGDPIPIASLAGGAAEMAALVSSGNATQIG